MGRIAKLPFILGCSAAIVTGSASYLTGMDSQGIYVRMAVMMLIFFIIGVYIRGTISSIKKEVVIRKIREQHEERERQRRQKEEERAAANSARLSHIAQPVETDRQGNEKLNRVDLAVDDSDEVFEPLTVSRAIRTKMNG